MKNLIVKHLIAALALLGAACASAPHPITLSLDHASVFIDDGGRGDVPILFIHGNGGSSAQWTAQLEHFRRSRRAVAIDLPGFGKSTIAPNADLSLPAMAMAIDRAAAAIHLDRFVIVGHSYGGAVVAAYAAAHPEKVAGVVYLDAAAMALPVTAEQKQKVSAAIRADKMAVAHAWFAALLKPSSEDVRKAVFASVEQTPTEVFLGALLSLTAYDAKSLVEAYRGPKLAIAAADIESPASFQLQFPQITVVKIAGAGHWLMLDKPQEVNAAIEKFLSELK